MKVICPIYKDSDTLDEDTKLCDYFECPHRLEHVKFFACVDPGCKNNTDFKGEPVDGFKSCACVEVG